jgi:hypothetical protein
VPVANPANGMQMVTNYCPIDPEGGERKMNNGWPNGLSDGLGRWSEFGVPGAPEASLVCEDHVLVPISGSAATQINGALHNNDKKNCLVAQLADAGAVLLPYSYAGATLSQQPSGPVFDFHTYDGSTTKQDPSTSVQKLDDELYSIHNVWHKAHIIVVGHSYGGLVAELWWGCIFGHCGVTLNHDNPSDDRGVVHVFSLDAPINGLQMATTKCDGNDPVFSAIVLLYGRPITALLCVLWVGQNARNRDILTWESTAPVPYTAIGVPDDPTYTTKVDLGLTQLSFDLGNIRAQVIYNFGCDPNNKQCIAQPPSYVLGAPNAPECSGNAPIYATTGHDIVKVCLQVVKFITCSVVAARDNGNQQACYPGAASPTPTSAQPTQTTPSSDLTKVDWANFTYFSSCFGNQQPFKARDGQATNDFILFQVYLPPTYGDLTGDGQPEAVVSYSCTGANFGGVHVLIYTGSAAHPTLLGDLPLSDPSDKLATVDSVNISNGDLQLTGRGFSPTAASCCPDLSVNNSYHWDGSRFVLVNSTVT